MKNNKIVNAITRPLIAALPSILAILAGFILGFIILLLTNADQAMEGFLLILNGGFTNGMKGVGQVIYYAVPIIMTGLSVGFAFKTGLFNIGAPGQFIFGAFAAVYVGVKLTWLPGSIHWLVAILAAMLAGAIWGAIPGILKAYFNVNEVISSIMMNYIGMNFVNMLVKETVYNIKQNNSLPVMATANVPKWGVDKLFPYGSVNGGIIIAIVFVIFCYIILQKTTFGYELKACGMNPNATKYAGINSKRNIVLSMVFAGMLSGIGGALLYLSGSGKYIRVLDILPGEGFNGIPVALLGLSHPIGILLSALFISHVTVGGFNLQLLNFDQEIINIIIGAIIYFSAFSLLFKIIMEKLFKGRKNKVLIEKVTSPGNTKVTEGGENI